MVNLQRSDGAKNRLLSSYQLGDENTCTNAYKNTAYDAASYVALYNTSAAILYISFSKSSRLYMALPKAGFMPYSLM